MHMINSLHFFASFSKSFCIFISLVLQGYSLFHIEPTEILHSFFLFHFPTFIVFLWICAIPSFMAKYLAFVTNYNVIKFCSVLINITLPTINGYKWVQSPWWFSIFVLYPLVVLLTNIFKATFVVLEICFILFLQERWFSFLAYSNIVT